MKTLLALSLLLLSGPAAAAEEAVTLRPIAVDLRRLYPQLRDRWDRAGESELRRDGRGFLPPGGHLASVLPSDASRPVRLAQGGVVVEQSLLGARPAPGRAEGGLLRYPNAYRATDALFIADDASVEQLFLLQDPQAPTSFVSLLKVRGGELSVEGDGALAVVDRSGETALRLAPPRVLDARGRTRRGSWTVSRESRGRYRVRLGFDPAGLEYPLLVD